MSINERTNFMTPHRGQRLENFKRWVMPLGVWLIMSWAGVIWAQPHVDGVRYMGHVPKINAGFEAMVVLTNHASIPKGVELKGYDAQGVKLSQFPIFHLDGNVVESYPLADLFPEEVSHFFISGSRQITVAMRVSTSTDNRGSDSMIQESSARARKYHIFPSVDGREPGYWEGMAIMNLFKSFINIEFKVEVTVSLKDSNHETIANHVFDLAATAKELIVFKSLFPQTSQMEREDYYYQVTATSDIAVTVLRGNTQRLDIASAFPISQLPLEGVTIGVVDFEKLPMYRLTELHLDDNVLTTVVKPERDCLWNVDLVWDGLLYGGLGVPEAKIALDFTTQDPFCFTFSNKFNDYIEKEFDLTGMLNNLIVDSSFFEASVIKLHLLDREGNIFKTLDWDFKR